MWYRLRRRTLSFFIFVGGALSFLSRFLPVPRSFVLPSGSIISSGTSFSSLLKHSTASIASGIVLSVLSFLLFPCFFLLLRKSSCFFRFWSWNCFSNTAAASATSKSTTIVVKHFIKRLNRVNIFNISSFGRWKLVLAEASCAGFTTTLSSASSSSSSSSSLLYFPSPTTFGLPPKRCRASSVNDGNSGSNRFGNTNSAGSKYSTRRWDTSISALNLPMGMTCRPNKRISAREERLDSRSDNRCWVDAIQSDTARFFPSEPDTSGNNLAHNTSVTALVPFSWASTSDRTCPYDRLLFMDERLFGRFCSDAVDVTAAVVEEFAATSSSPSSEVEWFSTSCKINSAISSPFRMTSGAVALADSKGNSYIGGIQYPYSNMTFSLFWFLAICTI